MSEKTKDIWIAYDKSGQGRGAYTDEKLLHKYASGKVLEIGCGRGKKIATLEGPAERFGVEISKSAIESAVAMFPNVQFMYADAENLPFEDNYFDFCYSLEVIEHVRNPQNMVREMVRVVKPGAYIFIQTPNYPTKRVYDFWYTLTKRRRSFADDPTHFSPLSFLSLRRLVQHYTQVEVLCSRNILFLDRFICRGSTGIENPFFLSLGQKTIIVGKK